MNHFTAKGQIEAGQMVVHNPDGTVSAAESIRAALLKAAREIERLASQPAPPNTLFVSPSRYQWAIDSGYILPDGTATPKFVELFGSDEWLISVVGGTASQWVDAHD